VVRRGTAAASVGALFPIPSGGKTGTTNDYTDVWYLGFTSDLVAGVWMGFDKPQRIMSNAQGGRLAAPAWTSFMTEVYRRKPAPPDWPRPAGIITATVDLLTNTQWVPGCPGVETTEYFIVGTEPTVPCNLMPGLAPTDTGGFSTIPPATFPPDGVTPTPLPRDTILSSMPPNPMGGRVVPGTAPMPRASLPRDTTGLPPAQRAPITSSPVPPRDTSRMRVDSVKRGGVIIRRDTLRPLRDTARPRIDSSKILQPDRRRPTS
jgi:membrane peptidoglycan carboxypeptidase